MLPEGMEFILFKVVQVQALDQPICLYAWYFSLHAEESNQRRQLCMHQVTHAAEEMQILFVLFPLRGAAEGIYWCYVPFG